MGNSYTREQALANVTELFGSQEAATEVLEACRGFGFRSQSVGLDLVRDLEELLGVGDDTRA